MTLILVPCKRLSLGKSRLSHRLDRVGRRSLCEAFLIQTLSLAAAVVTAPRVRLLTADSHARDLAANLDITTIYDEGSDLNSACSAARTRLRGDCEGADVLFLPTDLPCAEIGSLSRVVRQAGEVVIVPDRQGDGTNILKLSSAALTRFDFSYGEGSFHLHLGVARDLGFMPVVLRDADLAFDIDDPNDYRIWRERIREQERRIAV